MNPMKTKPVNGIGVFDLCKGMAILLTVLYHIQEHWNFSSSPMFSSVMTFLFGTVFFATNEAFFMIAGYGLRKRPVKKMFANSLKQTLKPYLISSALVVVFHFLSLYYVTRSFHFSYQDSLEQAGGFLLGLQLEQRLFGVHLYNSGVAWFILAFFWAGLFCNLVMNYVPEKWALPLLIGVNIIYALSPAEWSYFCLLAGAGNTLFFYIGHLAKKKKFLNQNLNQYLVILLLLTAVPYVLQVYVNPFGNLGAVIEQHRAVFYLMQIWNNVIGVTRAIIWAGIFIIVFVKLNGLKSRILDAIGTAGRYSMDVFYIHAVERSGFLWHMFPKYFPDRPILGFFVESVLRCILIALACAGLNYYKQLQRQRQARLAQLAPIKVESSGIGLFNLCKGIALLGLILYSVQSHWYFNGNQTLNRLFLLLFGTLFLGVEEAFFLMAGFRLRPMPEKKMLALQGRQTLLPCLAAGACSAGLFFLTQKALPLAELQTQGVGRFLLCFFWGSLVCNAARQLPRSWRLPVLAGLSLLSALAPESWGLLGLIPGLGAGVFFLLGREMKDRKLLEQDLTKPLLLLLGQGLVLFAVSLLTQDHLWLNRLLRPIAHGLWAGVLVLGCVKLTCSRSRILGLLSILGRYSPCFLFLHIIERYSYPWETLPQRYADHQLRGFVLELGIRFGFIFPVGCILILCKLFLQRKKEGNAHP